MKLASSIFSLPLLSNSFLYAARASTSPGSPGTPDLIFPSLCDNSKRFEQKLMSEPLDSRGAFSVRVDDTARAAPITRKTADLTSNGDEDI